MFKLLEPSTEAMVVFAEKQHIFNLVDLAVHWAQPLCMLNPGNASLMNESITIDDSDTKGELILDRTMLRLAEILQQASQTSLDGRFHIYNLFSLQNTSSKDAVKQEEWLQKAYTKNVEVISCSLPFEAEHSM